MSFFKLEHEVTDLLGLLLSRMFQRGTQKHRLGKESTHTIYLQNYRVLGKHERHENKNADTSHPNNLGREA